MVIWEPSTRSTAAASNTSICLSWVLAARPGGDGAVIEFIGIWLKDKQDDEDPLGAAAAETQGDIEAPSLGASGAVITIGAGSKVPGTAPGATPRCPYF